MVTHVRQRLCTELFHELSSGRLEATRYRRQALRRIEHQHTEYRSRQSRKKFFMIIIAMRLYAILSRLGCNGSLSLTRRSSVTLTSALLHMYIPFAHARHSSTVHFRSHYHPKRTEPRWHGTRKLASLAQFGFVVARFGYVHSVHANRTEPRQHGFKEQCEQAIKD